MAHRSSVPLTAAQSVDSILAAASYGIPILWLSLFAEADLESVEMALEDSDGQESMGLVPTLHTTVDGARSRYAARVVTLRKRIPGALHRHIEEWEALLASVRNGFVQIDLAEIWMMFAPAEFDVEVRNYLRAFDEAGEFWGDVCSQAGLQTEQGAIAMSFDRETSRDSLRGYAWESPVPWKDT
jgi:hypothetical protein